jgi:hypothetical protein
MAPDSFAGKRERIESRKNKMEFLITVFLFASLCTGFLLLLLLIKRSKAEAEKKAEISTGDSAVLFKDSSANFFGQESKGHMQIRGNGIFIITDENILFYRYLPQMELKIPVENIIAVESAGSFLGKSIFRPLLKIKFKTPSGNQDTAAWYLKEQEKAIKIISPRKG